MRGLKGSAGPPARERLGPRTCRSTEKVLARGGAGMPLLAGAVHRTFQPAFKLACKDESGSSGLAGNRRSQPPFSRDGVVPTKR